MRFIILLFIVIPAIEIGLFILSGKTIGVLPTVGLIILTGIVGAYFAKKQGLEALRRVQNELRSGIPPGNAMLDGVCILAGGLLLLTPGFLTDIMGLLLLLPVSRYAMRPFLLKLIKKWISRKQIYIYR
ncbi:membrane protein FxsA [Bacillus sp. FJAT-49732]|uniref:Membrane protein FxsA n=1 Tax=Lederbergia citrisecunda TaxID=2833583 RepID=A0A942YKT5_9BACI|nr:FxsA family protein [Lederbergia citrisecunda]MBS4199952.1 membrane protein FxsA [Lederbergia citrisecunda]